MNWFHELSSAGLAVLILGLTAGLSTLGLAIVVPRVRASRLHGQFDNGTITGLLSALIGVYAVAAGLTAVAVWENMGEANADVGKEVAAIAVLYRDLGAYPPPLQQQAKKALAAYVKHVIDVEWPMHERGQVPSSPSRQVEEAHAALQAFEPTTEGQKLMHGLTLQSYNKVLEAHWRRMQAVTDTALPGELWIVVTLLGAIAISSCFLLRVEGFAIHALVTLLVAAPIALVLYFIAVSDHPFQGGISVSVDPYRTLLERVILPDAALR